MSNAAGVFVRELAWNYEAISIRKDYQPESLQLQYGDFAIWQREHLQSDPFRTQLDYWKKKLAGAPPLLSLPYDRPRPLRRTAKGWTQTVRLDSILAGRLEVIARANGAPFFPLMLAAFTVLLYPYPDHHKLLIRIHSTARN